MGSPDAQLTPVERTFLGRGPYRACYAPDERVPAIVVDNFPALGELAALRFLEWAQTHPGGVIALPTGKTPEHFIARVRELLASWDGTETQALLAAGGLDPARRPDMRSFHFVQIDDFYPLEPAQHNSFHWYVSEYYLRGFGLDPRKALLIDGSRIGLAAGETLASVWPDGRVDLSLRVRPAASGLERTQKRVLEAVDQWCQEYEQRVRALGGLGFFLGGLGPDGHIGFNIRGSDHHSTTRLLATNYETQAAAAPDLGGMEVSRTRLAITIGLGTLTCHPACAAIILAAGAAKAGVVADAVQSAPHIAVPATALHKLPYARFYLTEGAAGRLRARQLVRLQRAPEVSDEESGEGAD